MHLITLLTVNFLLISCSIIYKGVVKNNYFNPVTIGSVQGDISVDKNNTTEVPIFQTQFGTCISVSNLGKTSFYHVPAPPKWAKVSGIWNVKFSLSVSPEGAFYIGSNGKKQKLQEVSNCND